MTCPDCFHLQQELQRLQNERDDILEGIAELRAIMATVQLHKGNTTWHTTSTTTNQ